MEFLVQTLIKHKLLDSLSLIGCSSTPLFSDIPADLSIGKMQVRQLGLIRSESPGTLPQILDDIGSNPFIHSLEIEGNFETFPMELCNDLIRKSTGLTELEVRGMEHKAAELIDALQENINLKCLRVNGVDETDLITFGQQLGNIPCLRKLTLDLRDGIVVTQDFYQTLDQSLESNSSLWTLVINNMRLNDTPCASEYLQRIRRRLAINRVGGPSLLTARVPVDIWPHVLVKSSEDPDGIYFALTGKPDIVAPDHRTVAPERKRKRGSS